MSSQNSSSSSAGVRCTRCGREGKNGVVFLYGSRAWVPFCPSCLYQSEDRISVAILATGLTEAELAERMDVSKHTIRDWRSGRLSRPKSTSLDRLADLAGVSKEWLEGKEDRWREVPACWTKADTPSPKRGSARIKPRR